MNNRKINNKQENTAKCLQQLWAVQHPDHRAKHSPAQVRVLLTTRANPSGAERRTQNIRGLRSLVKRSCCWPRVGGHLLVASPGKLI